jgi:membrane protein required for colicin V production
MPTLDWVFIAVLLISLMLGVWRGLVYELLSVLSWIAAFVLAQWFAPELSQKLPMTGASEVVRYVAGFVLIFVLSVFVGGLLAKLVKRLFSAVGLQPADRALGAAFGLIRGALVLLTATVVISMTPLKTGIWWQQSAGAGVTLAVLKGLKPVLPEEFGKYLP